MEDQEKKVKNRKMYDDFDNQKINSNQLLEHSIASVGSELGLGSRRQISLQNLYDHLSIPESVDRTSSFLKRSYELFGITSPCCSIFASPVWYLVWFSFILFFQSMVVNGFINSSIATLEKRYKLSSKESSLIASMYDLGCLLVVLPVSFYGNKSHKPRWVGVGAFLMGFGCFIFASPQFFAGPYKFTGISQKEISMCSNITTKINCGEKNILSTLKHYKYVFYLGQFCIGLGASPLFTLGLAYIEEINDRTTSSLHVGISTAITAIGPAVGYVTLGSLLKVYVDIVVPTPNLTPNETEVWVGAWWIGFVVAGFSFFLFSFPLIMFPKNIPHIESNESNEAVQSMVSSTDFYDIAKIVKSISLNLTYICVSIATTLTMLSLSGISTYGPKYFESVFGLTSSSSTITVGIVSVPTLATGALVGGILLSRYNWKLNGTMLFMAITTLISLPLNLVFLMKCEETKMAGVNVPYMGSRTFNRNNLTSSCNERCWCSSAQDNFLPSCGADETTYFSPCFAGCKSKENINSITTFKNCSCIDKYVNGVQLKVQTCKQKLCISFYLTLVMLGTMLFFTYLRGAPSVTATMRAVNREEIAVSLGCQSILSRILGSLPGPILFGTVIDKACILWGQKCDVFGNCIKYDTSTFTLSFFILMLSITFCNTICFIIPRLYSIFKSSKTVVSS